MELFKKIARLFISIGCCDIIFYLLPRPKNLFHRFCIGFVGMIFGSQLARKVEKWFEQDLEDITKCELLTNKNDKKEDKI